MKSKRAQEKETIAFMIYLYCKHKHQGIQLCKDCEEVVNYASERIDQCPLMETKTFCSACKVHCYKHEMREKIRMIMRYSGPRMLLHKPIMALRHVYIEQKEKHS